MSESASHFRDTVDRVFGDQVDREFLFQQEQTGYSEPLWQLTSELGIDAMLLPEEHGGVGADWDDLYEIISAVGRYGISLPLGETIIARWLISAAGLHQPSGAGTLVYAAKLDRVPWGRHVHWGLWQRPGEQEIAFIRWHHEPSASGNNMAREPRDRLDVDSVEKTLLSPDLVQNGLLYLGALLRSAQIAGGAFRLLEKASQYAGEREQFGRPLSKFQSVQHNLARLAAWAASIDAGARHAFHCMSTGGMPESALLAIAAAKYRASDLASQVNSIAHQLHGAIGFTYEHDLHFFSRRLWSWSAEFGGCGYWAGYLGGLALEQGSDGIWQQITGSNPGSHQPKPAPG
jgi:acyl-CoA dehydrogenase